MRPDDWILRYQGFNPRQEGLREALCTLGNGYFCTRGAMPQSSPEATPDVHYPGTYLAGGYNRLTTDIQGHQVENEDLANLPDWLPLDFRLPGDDWFAPHLADEENGASGQTFDEYTLELDLRRGVLHRDFVLNDTQSRRTRVRERRLVSMDAPHLAVLEVSLTPLNWGGKVGLRAALNGNVTNSGVPRYGDLRGDHLEVLETRQVDEETVSLRVRTTQSRIEVAQASRLRPFLDGEALDVQRSLVVHKGYVGQFFEQEVQQGQTLVLEKTVSLYSSRDHAITECCLEAEKAVARAGGFDDEEACHGRVWSHLWQRFDIEFHRDHSPQDAEHTEMVLRLYTFHLLQTTSLHTMDLDVGVPSRGWHGEAYRGHIFWDELFIFPMLNFRLPEITRSLLLYRFRRLDEAKAGARAEGLQGAMYPWQSGSNGREESQFLHLNPRSGRWIPDNSRRQRHVNAAIAYNILHYYRVTQDLEFMGFYGAEMFLQIARFWASMAAWNNEKERYEIKGVMGPDEYHEAYPKELGRETEHGLDNNAYTNVMASWVLHEAQGVFDMLPEGRSQELSEKLSLSQEELDSWKDIAARLEVVFLDREKGIISQFEDYDKLEEFDWQGYRDKYGDIQRLDRILEAENDTPNRFKASKQADVLMLFYLFTAEELAEIFERLGYDMPADYIPANIDYYLQRTSHGSTLSSVVHARVLSRSNRKKSWQLFRQALKSDIQDIQGGTTPEGIHTGAMAGTVDIIQRSYTDMQPRGDVLHFNPCLPEELTRLIIRIRYRKHSLKVDVTQDTMRVEALRTVGEPIKVAYEDDVVELCSGDAKSWELKSQSRGAE